MNGAVRQANTTLLARKQALGIKSCELLPAASAACRPTRPPRNPLRLACSCPDHPSPRFPNVPAPSDGRRGFAANHSPRSAIPRPDPWEVRRTNPMKEVHSIGVCPDFARNIDAGGKARHPIRIQRRIRGPADVEKMVMGDTTLTQRYLGRLARMGPIPPRAQSVKDHKTSRQAAVRPPPRFS